MDSDKFGNHYQNLAYGTAGKRLLKVNEANAESKNNYFKNQ